MNALITGIFSLYNAGGDLKTNLTGGLFYELAPAGTSLPYATFFIVTGRPEDYFTEQHEIVTVQFDIFAATNASRKSLYGYMTALYDDSAPTATGYTTIIMERTFQQPLRDGDQNEIFRYIVQYRAEIQKGR